MNPPRADCAPPRADCAPPRAACDPPRADCAPPDCDPPDCDPVPEDTIPTGKYSGQTVDDVWQVDQQYVWFLSQRSLNHVQCLRYKDFFDSCPAVVQRAKELTEGLSMPEVRQQQTSSSTFKPGGWRGW
jgi:hypothetical protein